MAETLENWQDIWSEQGEQWRTVAGSPEYFVSNLGRIYFPSKQKFPKHTEDRRGYKYVCIHRKRCLVHRVVAMAWLDEFRFRYNKCQIEHINGHRNDNRLCNLRFNKTRIIYLRILAYICFTALESFPARISPATIALFNPIPDKRLALALCLNPNPISSRLGVIAP